MSTNAGHKPIEVEAREIRERLDAAIAEDAKHGTRDFFYSLLGWLALLLFLGSVGFVAFSLLRLLAR